MCFLHLSLGCCRQKVLSVRSGAGGKSEHKQEVASTLFHQEEIVPQQGELAGIFHPFGSGNNMFRLQFVGPFLLLHCEDYSPGARQHTLLAERVEMLS